jgi:hypothetical protein
LAYASEVELSAMGSVRSMRKQESDEFIRGSVNERPVRGENCIVAARLVASRSFCRVLREELNKKPHTPLGVG